VADSANHLIRKITPDGISSRVAGSGIAGHANGSAGSARFDRPQGIDVDPGGRIYVADTFNHVIRLITRNGHVLTMAGMPDLSAERMVGLVWPGFERPSGWPWMRKEPSISRTAAITRSGWER
jgi:DNA-binding beta-propeller fold protein YncE